MNDLTKTEGRAVRELLGDAHEAELAAALIDVESALNEWRHGSLAPSQVEEHIHAFHKQSQEIFKTYNYLEPLVALARAVESGYVGAERVPASLQERVTELRMIIR